MEPLTLDDLKKNLEIRIKKDYTYGYSNGPSGLVIEVSILYGDEELCNDSFCVKGGLS